MTDVPIVGTDNHDFMMQGVANLVANQESADYGPNYHARSDEFGRADLRQLRLNAAIAAAVTWGSRPWTSHCRVRPRRRWIRWCAPPIWVSR